uniref:VWFA domain-containing protein n=1 Tax=Macrostomum lignano TaxID=282301 RepID=A0A1I8GAU0_9PLAT
MILLFLLAALACCPTALVAAQDAASGLAPNRTSLAIVFDTTGSMKDDLNGVKRGAHRILETEITKNKIANFILVEVNEPVVSRARVTTNPRDFQDMIDDIFVQGGGDCPESTVLGIKYALEAALPHSYIYVFTDASAKDPHLTNEVLDLIMKKESQVVFVLTGDCGDQGSAAYQAYQKISQASSGILIRIQKNEVFDIMNLVKVAVTLEKVNILNVDKELADDNNIYDIPVDTTIKQLTISVSGQGAKIESLQDPTGAAVDGAYNMTLPNVDIKSLSQPVAGHWTLKVSPPM